MSISLAYVMSGMSPALLGYPRFGISISLSKDAISSYMFLSRWASLELVFPPDLTMISESETATKRVRTKRRCKA